jgi:hypothetical protein
MYELELYRIHNNKLLIKFNDKLISIILKSTIKFGIEEFYNKRIINMEISKKIYKKISEIEKFIFNKEKNYDHYSSIRINKTNINLKPLLRTYLKYKKNILKTIVKKNNSIISLDEINKNDKIKADIYLDHIWIKKNKLGMCWYIDSITVTC